MLPPPIVVFRCDRTPTIGAGHLTRCRALASALARRDVASRFVLGEASRGAARELRADGFGVDVVAVADTDRLTLADLEGTLTVAERTGACCVVVDHYGAGPEYVRGLAATGLAVGVLDDLADRDLAAANWILNQSLDAASGDYADARRLALGADFALLRPQFAAARARLERRFDPADNRVLVTFGGGDTAELATCALIALEDVSRRLEVRVVLGSSGAAPLELQRAAAASPHAVELLTAIDEMAAVMAWADVSVNATGSTCWELMCLGVPMIAASLSPDQARNARALAAHGVAAVQAPEALDRVGATAAS